MKRLSVILIATVFMSGSLFAQSNSEVSIKVLTPESKEKFSITSKDAQALQQDNQVIAVPLEPAASKMESFNFLKSISHSKKPAPLNPALKEVLNERYKGNSEKKSQNQFQGQMTQLPSNIRYVGEFEESQAVLVAVPSKPFASVEIGAQSYWVPLFNTDFDAIYNYYTPAGQKNDEVMLAYWANCEPGDGILWPYIFELTENPNEVYVIRKENVRWFSDYGLNNGDTTNRYLWSALINAIQDAGATAWIRMTAIQDTTHLKNYMAQRGMPLTNYKFFYDIIGEDAFWVRDWGPHGFYYEENGVQKLGFHETVYYTGRPFDDIFPRKLLNEVGYNWYDLQIQMEGGNMMTDGWGQASYGDVVYRNNDTIIYTYRGQTYKSNPQGQISYDYAEKQWYIAELKLQNKAQLDARKKEAFNMTNPNIFKSLHYDGGTGHIDLWIKQFDEESMLISDMPDQYSGLHDYKLIQENRTLLNNRTTSFGTKFRFLGAPLPKRFDGPFPTTNGDMPTNNAQFNQDPRGYLNGTIVNKSYIYPSFSRTSADLCWKHDSIVKEHLQKLLPGYKLVPIDSRTLTPGGGAIHCITMQIPQDPSKTITIRHKPIRDYVELAQSFPISAELISNTDANKVVVYWKKINDTEWQTIEMASTDNKIWNGTISGSFVKEDIIRYFVAAKKDAAIRKCAPITGGIGANDGYYQFYFDETSSVEELHGFEPKASIIASIYPNPATDYLNVIFENITDGNVTIEIVNSLGQTLSTPVNKHFNKGVFIFDILNLNDLNSGVYFLKMTTASGVSTVNFVVK